MRVLKDTFLLVIFVNDVTNITFCTYSCIEDPILTISIDLNATSIYQVWSVGAWKAFSLILVELCTERQVAYLFNTKSILDNESSNTACAISLWISSGTVLGQLHTEVVQIKVVSSITVNTDSVIIVALTVCVNGHVILITWQIAYILLILRANTVNTFSIFVSMTFFALNTVTLIVPASTIFDNFDTNVFPLGASFITFNTLTFCLVPVLAQCVHFIFVALMLQQSFCWAHNYQCS